MQDAWVQTCHILRKLPIVLGLSWTLPATSKLGFLVKGPFFLQYASSESSNARERSRMQKRSL